MSGIFSITNRAAITGDAVEGALGNNESEALLLVDPDANAVTLRAMDTRPGKTPDIAWLLVVLALGCGGLVLALRPWASRRGVHVLRGC